MTETDFNLNLKPGASKFNQLNLDSNLDLNPDLNQDLNNGETSRIPAAGFSQAHIRTITRNGDHKNNSENNIENHENKSDINKNNNNPEELISELELVNAAREGDREAFELLVRRYERKVLALTNRMCGNPDDGAEAAQEAFISAWLGLPDFRGESGFATWLYRLASNACIDQIRRQRRHISHAGPSLDDEDAAPDLPDLSPSPETLAERADLRREIERALADLSPEHRQILILRETHQLSYHEIGQALNLEPGTVKSRVSRARSALRKILLGSGNFSDCISSIQTGKEGKS